jgi:ketosteroid isomerase-like protein
MKSQRSSLSFVVLAGVILLASACATEHKDVSADINAANKIFTEAFNQGNPKDVAANYASNAKLFPANSEVIEGQSAIEEFWKSVMEMGIEKVQLETVSADAAGDMAVEEGRYKLFMQGDQLADQGKYIVTWKKDNGKWKMYHDIWTTNAPLPTTRAMAGDTVWIINNRVKADKVAQFEEFNFNILEPAAAEHYPKMRNTVRTLKPVGKNSDGTFSYFYLMDAATSPDGYPMELPLKAKYGEEKAAAYLRTFEDCLKGEQEVVVTVQSKW